MFCKNVTPNGTFNWNNNYCTNIISPVMLLVAPISGLTVKISSFSLDRAIVYIHQHLFKIYYFQFEHCYDTSQNIHTPYPCICLFSLYLQPKYTAVGSFSWHYFPSSSLRCITLFSVSILIWTLTECFSVHFKYFCKFSIKIITIWHFYSNFSTTAIFFWRNGATVCDTRYLHSNRWWHHTIW